MTPPTYPTMRQQVALPAQVPTTGPSVRAIRPFYVRCGCTPCDADILVNGEGEFECPGCGCRVILGAADPPGSRDREEI